MGSLLHAFLALMIFKLEAAAIIAPDCCSSGWRSHGSRELAQDFDIQLNLMKKIFDKIWKIK